MSREGQHRGHTSLGSPPQLGIQGEPGVVPSSCPRGVRGPSSLLYLPRGFSSSREDKAQEKQLRRGKTTGVAAPSMHPQTVQGQCALCHHSLSLGSPLAEGALWWPSPI